MNIDKIINNPLFVWAPTLLFLLLVGLGFLVGVLRGLHKTKVYFKQTIILFIILFALYFFIVNTKLGDQVLLLIIDNVFLIIYGEKATTFYLLEGCSGAKEFILNLVPLFMPENDYLSLLLFNPGYLLTVVDLIFHIVFAIVFYVIYLILKLIINIIWLIFHSEKRYKLKIDNKFSLGKVDRPYQKRRLTAGFVSAFRSFLSCLLLFSILGTVFFMVSATNNHEKLDETKFPDIQTQQVVKLYQGVEKLGSQGIFKVLNSIKDNHDTPYYLLLCDVVLQGKLEDNINNVEKTIYFREEIGTYTDLSKRLYNLVMKYKGDELMLSLGGYIDTTPQDILIELLGNESFQKDFKNIIQEFDSKTFFVNLVVSLLDSFINSDTNILDSYLPFEVLEILKIAFKRNYLSEYIPDEALLIRQNQSVKDDDKVYLPTLQISNLIEKRDLNVIYDIVNEFITNKTLFPESDEPAKLTKRASEEDEESDESSDLDIEATIDNIILVIQKISDLSLFQGDKRDQLSPVLGRIYAYAITNFLQYEGEKHEISSNYYEFITSEVNWVDEIENLVYVAKNLMTIVNTYMTSTDIIQTLIEEFFNPDNPDYATNMSSFNLLLDTIKTSKLLASILSQSSLMDMIVSSITQISPTMTYPDDILLENTVINGKLHYNEMYCLLNALKILTLPQNQDIILQLTNGELTTDSMISLFISLGSKDSTGKSQIEHILDSKVLESLIGSFIIQYANSETIPLYIPKTSLKINKDNVVTNIIKKEDLLFVVNNISTIFDIVEPILLGNDVDIAYILSQITTPEVLSLLQNDIISGTITIVLRDFLKDSGVVVLPKHLDDIEFWIHPQNGELFKLLKCLSSDSIDIELLLNGSNEEALLNMLTSFTDDDINLLLDSDIFHYTISDILIKLTGQNFNGIELIIPKSAKQSLYKDAIDSLILKDELKGLLSNIKLFNNLDDTNKLLINVILNKDVLTYNKIILASSINLLVNNAQTNIEALTGNVIKIPNSLKNQATKEKLEELSLSNPWNYELRNLFTAVEELVNINDSNLDFEQLENDILDQLPTFNEKVKGSRYSKLQIITKSSIMLHTISSFIDSIFDDIVDSSDLEMAKNSDGSYKHEELEAIVNTITIFEINLREPNFDEVITKIKAEFLDFATEKAEYDNKSVIDLIYDSFLVKTMIRDSLDDILTSVLVNIDCLDRYKDGYGCYTTDEIKLFITGLKTLGINLENINDSDNLKNKIFTITKGDINTIYRSMILRYALSDNLINTIKSLNIVNDNVLNSSKLVDQTNPLYPFVLLDQLYALKDAFDELVISSTDGMNNIDFEELYTTLNNSSKVYSTKTRLDVLYDSYIIAGIISNSIYNNQYTSKYHHDFAFESDSSVYKKSEITALVNIIGGGSLDSFDPSKLTMDTIKQYIYDQDGKTQSYLICKAISDILVEFDTINIPEACLDVSSKTSCLHPQEIARLIDGLKALGINDISSSPSITTIPSSSTIDTICESMILRATFSKEIKYNGNGVKCYALRCIETKLINGNKVIMLTKEELKSLVNSINTLCNSNGLDFTFNLDALNGKDLNSVLDSSIISHIISGMLLESASNANILIQGMVEQKVDYQNFYQTDNLEKTREKTLLKENIIIVYNLLNNAPQI